MDFFPLSRVAYTARLLSVGLKPKPKVLGIDFAGTVESVGEGVTDFRPHQEEWDRLLSRSRRPWVPK